MAAALCPPQCSTRVLGLSQQQPHWDRDVWEDLPLLEALLAVSLCPSEQLQAKGDTHPPSWGLQVTAHLVQLQLQSGHQQAFTGGSGL